MEGVKDLYWNKILQRSKNHHSCWYSYMFPSPFPLFWPLLILVTNDVYSSVKFWTQSYNNSMVLLGLKFCSNISDFTSSIVHITFCMKNYITKTKRKTYLNQSMCNSSPFLILFISCNTQKPDFDPLTLIYSLPLYFANKI